MEILSAGNGTYYLVAVTYSRDESGAETVQEAAYIDFIHSAGDIAPIDAYVGQWTVQGLINTEGAQPQNFLLTIARAEEDGVLAVSGACPYYEGYDDTFYLMYDEVSGYVILPPQEVAALTPTEGVSTLVVPMSMEDGSFTGAETITGKLDEYGGLSFYNTYGNEGNWNSFAYVVSSAQGSSLVSYYASYFMPYAAAASTRSLVGTTGVSLPSLKPGMTLKKVEKQAKATDVNIVIKHLNGEQSIKNHGAMTPAQLN